MSLSVLTPHSYNRISSLIFPHTQSPHTVPESYYDDFGDHGAIELNTSTSMPDQLSHHPRANATLLMLARNSDLEDVVRSVRELEDRFNHKYRYPWVFLNEERFTDDFKRYVLVMPVLPSLNSCLLSSLLSYSRTHVSIQSRVGYHLRFRPFWASS